VGGQDSFYGGLGDDVFYIDSPAFIFEDANQGNDTIFSSFSFQDGYIIWPNVENLVLIGAALIGVGNDLGNRIEGNAGENTLDGGRGRDTLIGFGGDDVYFVDNNFDVVIDVPGDGFDVVWSSAVRWEMPEGIENFIMIGDGIRIQWAYGNSGNNFINGNSGPNYLVAPDLFLTH